MIRKTLNKTADGVKKIGNDMLAPTPPKDRTRRNISIVVGVIGFGLKLLSAYLPDYVPESLSGFFDQIFWAGIGGLGFGAYFQSKRVKN